MTTLPVTLPAHHKAIDITSETCPMTFVRTRLALDTLQSGDILLIRLTGADPGHEPLDLIEQQDGTWLLLIQKGG